MDKLAELTGISDQKTRLDKYKSYTDQLVTASDKTGLSALLEHLVGEDVPQMISRQVTTHFAGALSSLGGDAFEEVATDAVQRLSSQVLSFEEADYALRSALFDHHVAAGDCKEGASFLAGINVESGSRVFTPEEKAALFVKVAEAYLEGDESVDAETFVTRASGLMSEVTDWALKLRYRVTLARVLDARRKFLDAAMRFYELSQTLEEVNQDDLLELLGKAVTCAILGNAGPQRCRVLGLLCKDERIQSLEQMPSASTHAQVLTKMYKEQILRKHELAAFEASLMPHQKAKMGDGLSILERAVIEHNMVAVGRIYRNIRFEELGALLEITPAQAEKVAARMIKEGRLSASINQVEGLLDFVEDIDVLQGWDQQISAACLGVSACYESIAKKFPEVLDELDNEAAAP